MEQTTAQVKSAKKNIRAAQGVIEDRIEDAKSFISENADPKTDRQVSSLLDQLRAQFDRAFKYAEENPKRAAGIAALATFGGWSILRMGLGRKAVSAGAYLALPALLTWARKAYAKK